MNSLRQRTLVPSQITTLVYQIRNWLDDRFVRAIASQPSHATTKLLHIAPPYWSVGSSHRAIFRTNPSYLPLCLIIMGELRHNCRGRGSNRWAPQKFQLTHDALARALRACHAARPYAHQVDVPTSPSVKFSKFVGQLL